MSDESFNNNPNSSPPPGDQPANDAAMKIGDISDIADSHVNVAGGNLTQVHIEHAHFAAPLAPQPEPHPLPYHNLPRPDYACFVGREAELAWLRQRLHPSDRAWQIAITGIGGVGKSALALAIAHEYRVSMPSSGFLLRKECSLPRAKKQRIYPKRCYIPWKMFTRPLPEPWSARISPAPHQRIKAAW